MIQIDMEMPIDCRHCNFSSKIGIEAKCLVTMKIMHYSWIEPSLDNPMRPLDCPLKEVKGEY